MDFFSNFVKNTATKVETLTKSATAAANSAVNSLSPTGANSPDEGSKSPTEGVAPVEATGENGAVVNELGAGKAFLFLFFQSFCHRIDNFFIKPFQTAQASFPAQGPVTRRAPMMRQP